MSASRTVGDAATALGTVISTTQKARKRISLRMPSVSALRKGLVSGEATDSAAGYCHSVPERWTRAVLRFRVPMLLAWLAVLVAGAFATAALPKHLSNVFTVPGTESDTARQILQHHFGERSDGVFTVVFRAPRAELPLAQR